MNSLLWKMDHLQMIYPLKMVISIAMLVYQRVFVKPTTFLLYIRTLW